MPVRNREVFDESERHDVALDVRVDYGAKGIQNRVAVGLG